MDAPSVRRAPATDARAPAVAWLLPLLCLAGACDAVYLSYLHYSLRFGSFALGNACGGASNDCYSVVASRYGSIAGVPVSVLGLCFYVVAGALSLGVALMRRNDGAPAARWLARLALVALAFDVYLAWAMWTRLERLCPLCVASYAINLGIALVAWRMGRAPRHGPNDHETGPSRPAPGPDHYRVALKRLLVTFAVIGVVLTLAGAGIASRASARAERQQLASLLEYVRTTSPITIATEGRPARGPTGAKVTLVVFSDFLCEQCKRASRYLDVVAANHRDDVRIVYRHFPSDSICSPGIHGAHSGACDLARAAECAARQGRFWEFHDAVFADPRPVRATRIASYRVRAGLDSARFEACWNDPATDSTIAADIAAGRAVEIDATPAVFVNGRAIVGALKPWLMEEVIEAVEARKVGP